MESRQHRYPDRGRCLADTAEFPLVSFKQLPFPQLTTATRAYRAILDVHSPSMNIPIMVDVILIGRGRTEITFTIGAFLSAKPSVSAAELRFARLLTSGSS